jgi:portal protein
MGALADWWRGTAPPAPRPTAPAAPRPTVSAAAGRVAIGRGGGAGHATPAWAFAGAPPLTAVEWDGVAPPWFDRGAAMSLPTISRCRDLICSSVAALPFTAWQVDASKVPVVERGIPGPGWFGRPDPDRTRQWLLAWTVDDLMFYEVAHWEITGRLADSSGGWPSTFRRIRPGNLEVRDDGTVVVTDDPSGVRREVDASNVVEFQSPIEGMLSNGWRAISIALQLDDAADRFAGTEVPAGVLEEQDGGEDMTSAELAELAATFTLSRQMNTTAAVNKYVRYREVNTDPSTMQLVEGRTYQALELARLGNVPAYLVGAPAGGGMTYQNALQAKGDLIDFGAAPYIGCIEQTLSGPNVTPRGNVVRLDQNAWLRNPFTTATPSPNDLQIADPTTPPDTSGAT